MVSSMTGFARQERKGEWGSVTCEMRSVNHRFLDISFRLPDTFRDLETALREHARAHLVRGKVECFIRFQPGVAADYQLTLNQALLPRLLATSAEVRQMTAHAAPVDVLRLLQWPDVLQVEQAESPAAKENVTAVFQAAVTELVAARQREGHELCQAIEQRLRSIKTYITQIQGVLPELQQEMRNRISTRFQEAQVELDANRLEQEMVMLAQKTDVAEELDRLNTHITEMQRALQQTGSIGRRLDFLLQEMNREVNTLSSKSLNNQVTYPAVELKVLIEQIREQVQNIE